MERTVRLEFQLQLFIKFTSRSLAESNSSALPSFDIFHTVTPHKSRANLGVPRLGEKARSIKINVNEVFHGYRVPAGNIRRGVLFYSIETNACWHGPMFSPVSSYTMQRISDSDVFKYARFRRRRAFHFFSFFFPFFTQTSDRRKKRMGKHLSAPGQGGKIWRRMKARVAGKYRATLQREIAPRFFPIDFAKA